MPDKLLTEHNLFVIEWCNRGNVQVYTVWFVSIVVLGLFPEVNLLIVRLFWDVIPTIPFGADGLVVVFFGVKYQR